MVEVSVTDLSPVSLFFVTFYIFYLSTMDSMLFYVLCGSHGRGEAKSYAEATD